MIVDYKAAYEQAQSEIRSLEEDLANATVDRDEHVRRMQSKISRQREALRLLNRRVVAQRFELRTINELGRGLNADERQDAYGKLERPKNVDLTLVA